jgi:hypothetical protein
MRYILPSSSGSPTRMWAGGWGQRVFLQPSNYPITLDGLDFRPIEEGHNGPGVFFAADGHGDVRMIDTPDLPQYTARWTHFAPLNPEKRYKVPEDGLYVGDLGIDNMILMCLQGTWYKIVMHRNDEGSCYVLAESAAVIVGTKLKMIAPLTFELRGRRGASAREGAAAPNEPSPQ